MIDITEFLSIQAALLSLVPRERARYLREKIDWGSRLTGIVGARGTGKTTMLLQQLAELEATGKEELYLTADHIRIQANGLYETAAYFFRLGGKRIVIDEVHKYANWQQELKNLYDSFPSAKIIFSGSSTLALQKGKADLSRRVVFYTLPGLSFREYLSFSQGVEWPPVSLSQLLKGHVELAAKVVEKGPILGHFKDYLDHGAYPFFLEGTAGYVPKLLNVIEKVLYEDIPSAIGIRMASVPVLKRVLWLLATSQPFTPNIEKMSRDLKVSKEYLYTYLDSLERAGLIIGLLPAETGYRLVRKPSKIYMENTNLLRAVAGDMGMSTQVGAVRETFFAHQVRSSGMHITVPNRGDFLVEGKFLFEIGGKAKKKKQIKEAPDAYVVRDDIEVGFERDLPLWLFGFLY
ncbi:MAG: ATP-binding protein [Deltaproteobacteria bacterium]|nr:ATP-binding protein [Deltaproteobacteria bacterium]